MGKDKTTKQAGAGKGKKPKVPELEDFFTIALGKKNRNIEKKLKHAQELVDKSKTDKVELTTAQTELVARKPELLKQIEANNDIKAMYLDAWMKREEEPKVATEAAKVEAVVVDETEVENRGVRKALNAVTKLMFVNDLLRNQECCNKFSALSGLTNLESVMEFTSQNCRCNGENQNRWTASQELLFNFVARTPVATSSGKPLVDLCDLVDSVANSAHFDKFVPVEETPVVVPEPVQASPKKMSEHAVVMTRSRKESEAQQDVFMAEDDDSEDDEPVQTQAVAQNGATDAKMTENKPKDSQVSEAAKEPRAPKKQAEKAPAKRKGEFGGDLDSEDDEWITNTRAAKPYNGERGRGGRGGRGGYRGRGNYRGGKDGERLERGPRKEGEEGGERRPWNKDGEGGERRPWNKDGERGERGGRGRGERGRGERGRGGYRGKKPWTEGGDRRNFTKGTNEGEKPQGEGQAPLKEIGTNEQAPAKVEAPKQE